MGQVGAPQLRVERHVALELPSAHRHARCMALHAHRAVADVADAVQPQVGAGSAAATVDPHLLGQEAVVDAQVRHLRVGEAQVRAGRTHRPALHRPAFDGEVELQVVALRIGRPGAGGAGDRIPVQLHRQAGLQRTVALGDQVGAHPSLAADVVFHDHRCYRHLRQFHVAARRRPALVQPQVGDQVARAVQLQPVRRVEHRRHPGQRREAPVAHDVSGRAR